MSSTNAEAPALMCPRTGTATQHDMKKKTPVRSAQTERTTVPSNRVLAGKLVDSSAAPTAYVQHTLRRVTWPVQLKIGCRRRRTSPAPSYESTQTRSGRKSRPAVTLSAN